MAVGDTENVIDESNQSRHKSEDLKVYDAS